MMNSILKKLVLTLLIYTLLIPAANAGVVKRLVEVDPEQQQIEEQEAIEEQKAYKEDVQVDVVQKAKEILDEQIQDMPIVKEEPKKVVVKEDPAKYGKNDYSGCFVCRPGGVLSGVVVSPFAGLVRGAVSKAGTYASSLHDSFGGGFFGKLFGYPIGVISGAITGGVSGLGNGLLTGIVKGYQEPFTSQSYSLQDGDYDPYNFIGGQ